MAGFQFRVWGFRFSWALFSLMAEMAALGLGPMIATVSEGCKPERKKWGLGIRVYGSGFRFRVSKHLGPFLADAGPIVAHF